MLVDPSTLSHAEGCLLGQLAGDSLGSLVEFQSPEEIARKYQTAFGSWRMEGHGGR